MSSANGARAWPGCPSRTLPMSSTARFSVNASSADTHRPRSRDGDRYRVQPVDSGEGEAGSVSGQAIGDPCHVDVGPATQHVGEHDAALVLQQPVSKLAGFHFGDQDHHLPATNLG